MATALCLLCFDDTNKSMFYALMLIYTCFLPTSSVIGLLTEEIKGSGQY